MAQIILANLRSLATITPHAKCGRLIGVSHRRPLLLSVCRGLFCGRKQRKKDFYFYLLTGLGQRVESQHTPMSNMTTETTTDTAAKYWASQALKTRAYGHTYVHADKRQAGFSFKAHQHGDILFSWEGYGRSLQGGGHKYKVHARNVITGKPVSSKILKGI